MDRQFLVPQFIDVEDKIIGPITTRQFVLALAGALLIFIEYSLTRDILFIFLAIVTVIIFGILAFLKVNGMPFHYFLLNLVQSFKRPNIRIWNKSLTVADLKSLTKVTVKEVAEQTVEDKRVTTSQLSKLSLVVNTGGVYRPEDDEPVNTSVASQPMIDKKATNLRIN